MIYFLGDKELHSYKGYNHCSLTYCLEYFKNKKYIGVDTETTGFDPHTNKLQCIQLGDKENQFVIDTNIYPIDRIKHILTDKTKVLIFQNAKFDLKFLYKQGFKPIDLAPIYDTFLAECILTTGHEERSLGLGHLVEKYCNVTLDKSMQISIHKEGLTDKAIIYSANDVVYLEDIMNKQLIEIQEWGLEETLKLENDVVKVFAQLEFNGIELNTKKWTEVAELTTKMVGELEQDLDNIVTNEPLLSKYVPKYIQGNLFGIEERKLKINWSSNKQKLEIINKLGLNLESVGARFLQKNRHFHNLISKLRDDTRYNKLSTAFVMEFLNFINPSTNRIHCSVFQILKTGRISVSDPNVNQIPSKGDLGKTIRSCFVAKEGYSIVGGDFSGMELRIIAEFSQDKLWLDAFNNNQDLHSVLAAATFNIPIEDVKKETPFKAGVTYRDVQKIISFGLAYGMSKFKLADTIDISVDEAEAIINKFFNAVPKVKSFLVGLGNLGKSRGYIRTAAPFSRVRWFPKWKDATNPNHPMAFKYLGEIERESMNTPIQGCNGDLVKLALVNTQKVIDENNYPVKILLSVYDEIQTECLSTFAEEWKVILDNIMVTSAQTVIKSIPVVVDCKISNHWSK